MSGLELKRHAEVVKLGRLLSEPPERLDYLERLEPGQLRELRELATDVHYDSDQDRFKRIALASMLLPASLTAVIARKAFGALLCARIAGVLGTDHAIALAGHMPTEFLADLAVELDPRRASAIIAGMPSEQIADVAEVLADRREFVAMGRFVGHMTDEAIIQSLAVIDEPSLLRISYVLEGDEGLERVIGLMSSTQLVSAIRAAADHDLWPEALDLLARVSQQLAGRLGDLAANEDDRVLTGMVETAQRDMLWDVVLPVTRAMTDTGRRRFAAVPAIHRPEVLVAIVRSATLGDSWRELLPLVPLLPRDAQLRVWAEVVAVAEKLPPATLRSMATDAMSLGVDDMLPDIVSSTQATGLWEPGLRLLVALGRDLQQRLAPIAADLPADQRFEALAQARALGLGDGLGPLSAALGNGQPSS